MHSILDSKLSLARKQTHSLQISGESLNHPRTLAFEVAVGTPSAFEIWTHMLQMDLAPEMAH